MTPTLAERDAVVLDAAIASLDVIGRTRALTRDESVQLEAMVKRVAVLRARVAG